MWTLDRLTIDRLTLSMAQVELLSYKDHTHGLTETPKGEGDGIVNIAYFLRAA